MALGAWGQGRGIGFQPVVHTRPALAVSAPNIKPVVLNLAAAGARNEAGFLSKPIAEIMPIADRVLAKNPETQLEDARLKALIELADSDADSLSDADETALTEAELAEFEAESADSVADLEPLDEPLSPQVQAEEKLLEELLAAAEARTATTGTAPEMTDYGPFLPEHWRTIRFDLLRPDGDSVKIWLARPTWWLVAENVIADGDYRFEMEEVGAVGMARVVSISACPEPPRAQSSDHHLVTGKFEHIASNVINLYVEGQDEPIGTTANHPFWSEDRRQFVEAERLVRGENLLNAKGERVRVLSQLPRHGPTSVYNLEVDGEHVYGVSETGICIHNNCWTGRIGEALAKQKLAARGWRVIHSLTHGRNGIDIIAQKMIRGRLRTIIVEVKANSGRLSKLQKLGADGYATNVMRRFATLKLSPGAQRAYKTLANMKKSGERIRGVVMTFGWSKGVFKESIKKW